MINTPMTTTSARIPLILVVFICKRSSLNFAENWADKLVSPLAFVQFNPIEILILSFVNFRVHRNESRRFAWHECNVDHDLLFPFWSKSEEAMRTPSIRWNINADLLMSA